MIIAVEDKSYRCKNCDSFSQCEYYRHRRPDSHICKEFRNDWRQRDVLDKISAEITEKAFTEEIFDEDVFRSTFTENMTREEAECESVIETEIVKLSDVLEILEKYKGDSEC